MNDNRQNIIDATERLLQTHGLARLTTREIAREAKVAEGLIYHHFKDKAELIFEVVETRVRETKNIMQNLPLEVGKSTLLKILEGVLLSVYHAHYEITPIINSIFADQKLRDRLQEIVKERNMGPRICHRRTGCLSGCGAATGADLGCCRHQGAGQMPVDDQHSVCHA